MQTINCFIPRNDGQKVFALWLGFYRSPLIACPNQVRDSQCLAMTGQQLFHHFATAMPTKQHGYANRLLSNEPAACTVRFLEKRFVQYLYRVACFFTRTIFDLVAATSTWRCH
jgi:hypothetical protein